MWRPSPESIYPALSQLEDEGLIEPHGKNRKTFTLTQTGSEYVGENREHMSAPWKGMAESASFELAGLRESSQTLAAAATQVAKIGNNQQLVLARGVMNEARRRLSRIFAGEAPDPVGAEEKD